MEATAGRALCRQNEQEGAWWVCSRNETTLSHGSGERNCESRTGHRLKATACAPHDRFGPPFNRKLCFAVAAAGFVNPGLVGQGGLLSREVPLAQARCLSGALVALARVLSTARSPANPRQ